MRQGRLLFNAMNPESGTDPGNGLVGGRYADERTVQDGVLKYEAFIEPISAIVAQTSLDPGSTDIY